MTTDLVPADNMAALEALDPTSQEAAVTHMLSEARGWLAHAKEATDPTSIAHFKAQMATVAEATKQLNLSKEIQLDAQEMVRRAERGVGVAIRTGQEAGEIARIGDKGGVGAPGVNGALSGRSRGDHLGSPHVVAGEHKAAMSAIYQMSDVPTEVFEEALTSAKAEGNPSRAAVIRKIRDAPTVQNKTRQQRAEIIRDMASQGYSSRQMPAKVGVTEESVRVIARDFDIEIPADKVILGTRHIDSTNVVEQTILGLEADAASIDLIDWSTVNLTRADEWASSLKASLQALKGFQKQLTERLTHS